MEGVLKQGGEVGVGGFSHSRNDRVGFGRSATCTTTFSMLISNPDTNGTEESVHISEVSLFQRYTGTVLGEIITRECQLRMVLLQTHCLLVVSCGVHPKTKRCEVVQPAKLVS